MDERELLLAIRGRKGAAAGCGIATAYSYLSTIASCAADRDCAERFFDLGTALQWQDALAKSSEVLVYGEEDMRALGGKTAAGEFGGGLSHLLADTLPGDQKKRNEELLASIPKSALMTFECVVTTTKQDHDGDVLETSGADLDPKAPLLWQHIPMSPIGRVYGATDQTAKKLKTVGAIADTLLGNDAVVLVEFDALRISHGFKPIKWEPLKKKPNDDGPQGYHVLVFKILEVSLVSVPSNDDAEITAFSRDKLHHPLVKAMAQRKFDARPLVLRIPAGMKDAYEITFKATGAAAGNGRPAPAPAPAPTPAPAPSKCACGCGKPADKCGGEGGTPGPCPAGGGKPADADAPRATAQVHAAITKLIGDLKGAVQSVADEFKGHYDEMHDAISAFADKVGKGVGYAKDLMVKADAFVGHWEQKISHLGGEAVKNVVGAGLAGLKRLGDKGMKALDSADKGLGAVIASVAKRYTSSKAKTDEPTPEEVHSAWADLLTGWAHEYAPPDEGGKNVEPTGTKGGKTMKAEHIEMLADAKAHLKGAMAHDGLQKTPKLLMQTAYEAVDAVHVKHSADDKAGKPTVSQNDLGKLADGMDSMHEALEYDAAPKTAKTLCKAAHGFVKTVHGAYAPPKDDDEDDEDDDDAKAVNKAGAKLLAYLLVGKAPSGGVLAGLKDEIDAAYAVADEAAALAAV
jgi:hypothetical protein